MKHKMQITLLASAVLLGCGYAKAQNIYPNNCYNGMLTDYQTSWIANDGGIPRTHVPHNIDALYVREDGLVATICGWDEGGTNVGIWKDGQIVSIPVESGTGSWGRNSGKAVVMDEHYVYQLMRFNGNSGNSNLNSNGLPMYPPKGSGIEWQLITRYDVNTGAAARFSEGYGPLNNMLQVVTQEERLLQGLAIAGDKLITAVPGISELSIPDSLKIYDKTTMSSTPAGGFRINEGGVGYLHADKRGFVWMLQPGLRRIVAINLTNGGIRQQSIINLPEGVDAKSFSIDARESGQERILVANSGIDLNILIYTNIYNNPTLSSTFGVTGGILVKSPKPGGGEYLQGEAGFLRFPGPTGVGIDDEGNLYIANTFVNSPSAALYSYNETTQEMNWKQEGLVFTSTGDFDQTQANKVYGIEKIFELDYSKQGKRMDTFIATTVDPFAYPQDFRLEPNPPAPIKTGVFKRKIQGQDYLFVTNMYSSTLGGYRFDTANKGYIAIPCMEIRADRSYYWVDANGDGQQSPDEQRSSATLNTFSIYPDHDGNVWATDRGTQPAYSSFRLWRVSGTDNNGVLQYAAPVTYRLPAYIKDINRILYDVERDEMLVACYTEANPTPNTSIWGQVGTTILTYKNMTEKLANIAAVPSENWQHDQELVIPASPRTSLGTSTDPGVEISCKAMTYAGDYIFCFLTADGKINIYERDGSNLFVGQLGPGDEVQKRSGWTDFTYALNARKNSDGTYELLAEENAFAKIIHYNLRSFQGDITMNGDLAPQRIWVQNGGKENIDQVNIPEGQPVKFTVRVRNVESGAVVPMRRSDPGRCMVQFKVTNLAGNQVVYEALSNVYEEDIYGGDYVDMSVDNTQYPLWIYTKGNYKVDVDVNYGKKGKECSDANNFMLLNFGGGNNTGQISVPTEIDEVAATAPTLSVSPNPANNHIRIDVNTDEGSLFVVLTTADGEKVISQVIPNHSALNIAGLSQGYYILQVIAGKETLTQKVIIK